MVGEKYSLPNLKNAITSFSVVVDFPVALQPLLFDEVIAELNRIKTALELPAPIQIQQIGINLGGPPAMSVSQPPFTLGFQRFAPNGAISESILCEPQSITYTTSTYTGWGSVKKTVMDTVGRIFSIYVKSAPAISSFRLQYVNNFVCKESGYASANELFRNANRWIPAYLSDATDAWHVHVGKFTPRSEIDRLLLNVNFDFSQMISSHDASPFSLNALILCGVFYNIPGKPPLVLDIAKDSPLDVFEQNIETAHTEEKKALSEIFSDPYLRLMGAIE